MKNARNNLYLTILVALAVGCGRLWAAEGDVPVPLSHEPFSYSSTSNSGAAPELGLLPTPGVVATTTMAESEQLKKFQTTLDLGKQQRLEKSLDLASETLSQLLESEAPAEVKRPAMFELALVAQDQGKFIRAEQIFGQYLHTYPEDLTGPEVLLRQGLIYRQMGIPTLAVSKFYAVMGSALKLKLADMDYYKKIVLQSQVEIADTYYLEGDYGQASDFYGRLLRGANAQLDQRQIHYKLIRSLANLTNSADVVAQSQIFLNLYSNSVEIPEVRFLLASALKKLGHNGDAMKQVLLLLQSQTVNVQKNPEVWTYWQQRAGNEIANQLYKEGDFFNALQIYLSLADLDKTPSWQLPAWYQTGLVYEQLQQFPKATEVYDNIIARKKDLTESNSTPALESIIDMAKWRKDYLAWMQRARLTEQSYTLNSTNNPTNAATQ
jgi:tetratricopeptide (TPR) repeat protein